MKNATKKENVEIVSNIIDKVRHISDDANTIINSLQVQDITAQQLAAVNHLLENIQNRLAGIMSHLNSDDGRHSKDGEDFDETIKISTLHRDIAFDPDAIDSLAASEHRQGDIDALLSDPDLLSADSAENEVSADDILNNFTNMNNSSASEKPHTTESVQEVVEDEEFSQDDIDAMFN
jgi:hypothetical protein